MMSAKVAIRAPVSVAHESESSGWREAARGATFRRPDGGALMPTPVIVSATRTAIGTLGGALAQTPATRLGGVVVREAMRRARLEPAQVDEVILGHVLPRSEEHTSELQSPCNLVCRLLLEKKKSTT